MLSKVSRFPWLLLGGGIGMRNRDELIFTFNPCFCFLCPCFLSLSFHTLIYLLIDLKYLYHAISPWNKDGIKSLASVFSYIGQETIPMLLNHLAFGRLRSTLPWMSRGKMGCSPSLGRPSLQNCYKDRTNERRIMHTALSSMEEMY